jgi:hypothetical protein
MDMRGPVIIGVDHDTQSANAKNRRHLSAPMLPQTQALRYCRGREWSID